MLATLLKPVEGVRHDSHAPHTYHLAAVQGKGHHITTAAIKYTTL